MWLHLPLIEKLVTNGRKIFANAEYATSQVPTYPCGQIGFLLMCKEGEEPARRSSRAKGAKKRKTEQDIPSCRQPVREPPKDMELKYYSTDLHSAAFTLPAFITKVIESVPAYFEKEQPAEAKDEGKMETQEKPKKAAAKGRGKGKKAADKEEPKADDKPAEDKPAEPAAAPANGAPAEASKAAMETA